MDWPFFKKSKFSTENIKKSFGFMYVNPISKLLNESQKGLDPNKASNTFNIKDVEEHPVDFSMMQGIYDKSGIVTSVINK